MSFGADEEILQDFLVEAGEILEQLSEQLVELESRPDDADLLNAIFRGFHTVKGGAGFLQLNELVECCHIAENVFDILRKGERRVDSELMDVVLEALDAVNGMFSQVRERTEITAATPELLAALARLADTPQDPIYHAEGDVWIHTCLVVEALLAQPAYQQASAEQRFVLFFAALLHDIAKPDTTVIDKDTGRIGQPGHSRRGAVDARLLLWRAGVPFELREQICRIIAVHQVPFFALQGDRSGRSPESVSYTHLTLPTILLV